MHKRVFRVYFHTWKYVFRPALKVLLRGWYSGLKYKWPPGVYKSSYFNTYAAVNWHLKLPLLKDRQRFDAVSTSNLEVYKFRNWWILTYFISGHGESSLNNTWSMLNLDRTYVSLFYYFLCLKANLGLEKNKSAWWIFTQLYFRGGESWPNYFGKEVNWWWILT